jgi:RNA polymerase sigma-70 factor (ECF subfamily)
MSATIGIETSGSLLQRAGAGDHEAFSDLISPHLTMFHFSILRIVKDPSDAQDALQDALLSIYQDLPRFEGRSQFSSWAYRICINAALQVLRSRKRRQEEFMEDFASHGEDDGRPMDAEAMLEWSTEPDAPLHLEREEIRIRMMKTLDLLPDGLRVVFVLKDIEDMDTQEIANQLNISQTVVRQRLHRARMFLQARLKPVLSGRLS